MAWITVAENLLMHEFDEATVVLNLNTEKYYTLNGVALRMWQVITNAASFDEAAGVLCAEYDVNCEDLRADLRVFLERLHAFQFIELHAE